MPNTLKSGLDAESQFVPGESREEFAQLQSEYFDQFQPANAEQRYYADSTIRNEWLFRRKLPPNPPNPSTSKSM